MSQLAASREQQSSPPAQQPGGLLALAQQERHYELVAAGYQLLTSTPGPTKSAQDGPGHTTPGLTKEDLDHARSPDRDAALVMLMLRSLVALGLGGPARELLQFAKQSNLDIDVDAVRAMLVPVPIGRVPWSELLHTFEANLDAVRAAQPALVSTIERIRRDAGASQLFRTSDGSLLLAGPRTHGLRAWNPGFVDPASLDRVAIPEPTGGQPIFIAGLGTPAVLERAIRETHTPAGQPGVLLLLADTDHARALATLHTCNLAPLIASGRARLFLGEDADEQFASFLQHHADVDLPGAAIVTHWCKALGETLAQAVQRERARRDQEFKSITVALATRDRERDRQHHAERLRPGATILGFTSRFTTMLQFSMRDIGDALREHGYNFVLVREEDDQRTHSSLTIARAVHEHDPALVIMINHFRRERAKALAGVPVLTWIQDPTPLVLSRATGESLTDIDVACGYYVTECTEQFAYPRDRFFSLCLPVSSHLFHDAPLDEADAAQYACDVMYVGHRHAGAEDHVQSWRDSTPAGLHPLLESLRTLAHALVERNQPVGDAPRAVRELAHQHQLNLTDADVDRIANYFLTRLHDILYRAQTLHWVAEWTRRENASFRIYGRGWDQDSQLAPFAVGPVEHGEPLRKACRGAKIVLQTLPAGFMHQRTFEGFASGSLVLARHADTSSAHLHFPAVERVIFDGKRQLLDMLTRYRHDDTLRASVTEDMRRVVLSRFTYSAVMPELVEFVRGSLRSS